MSQKGLKPQKGDKLAPNLSFLFSSWRYLEVMCTVQIWSKTVENCSIYDRPHFLVPKIAPCPYAPFRTHIVNLHTHFRHYYAKCNCKIANVKNIRIHRYEASYLGAPKKGQYQKRAQICPIWNFLFLQAEIPSNNEYRPNLKPNGWKLLHLWPTALSGTQNCPIPIGPFWGTIRNLGNYHLLDIITKERPAKFQIKRTAGSKV